MAKLSDIKMVEVKPSTFVPESDVLKLLPAGTEVKTLQSGERVFVAPPPPWKEFSCHPPKPVGEKVDWLNRTIDQVDVHGRVIAKIPISTHTASLGPDAHIGAVCE